MDDYDKRVSAPFEGTYTAEEVELNVKLYEECIKDEPNWDTVENLLKQGADPLGAIAVTGCELLAHVYEEIIDYASDLNSTNLPRITELFLKYGMDVERPRIPYDEYEGTDPMWSFIFVKDENGVQALKMLLDNGLSPDGFAVMFDHMLWTSLFVYGDDPSEDFYNNFYTWMMKRIMLCASYDRILEKDEVLRKFIDYSANSYDVHKFREWNNYIYEFDTSQQEGAPSFTNSVIRIYETESKKEVWKIAVRYYNFYYD